MWQGKWYQLYGLMQHHVNEDSEGEVNNFSWVMIQEDHYCLENLEVNDGLHISLEMGENGVVWVKGILCLWRYCTEHVDFRSISPRFRFKSAVSPGYTATIIWLRLYFIRRSLPLFFGRRSISPFTPSLTSHNRSHLQDNSKCKGSTHRPLWSLLSTAANSTFSAYPYR